MNQIKGFHAGQTLREKLADTERRRSVAEGLGNILSMLNANSTEKEVLSFVCGQATKFCGAQAAAAYHADEETSLSTLLAGSALSVELAYIESVDLSMLPLSAVGRYQLFLCPVLEHLVGSDAPSATLDFKQREWLKTAQTRFSALLGMPLMIRGVTYGALLLFYVEARERFSEQEINIACTIGEQAMLALENSQIRLQAEQAAISTERARLARDLHDSVTQILFTVSLIAEVLPRLWEKDQADGRAQLAELRSLTKSALAEMRGLLYELRPTALFNTPLPETLHHLVEGAAGRASIPIHLITIGNTPLPPEIKMAMYRITQEALNNIVKHADAAEASVTLKRDPEGAELSIVDDGRGFVPEAVAHDRLGLNIIHERALAIGAHLQIESHPGRGTQIDLTWHRPALEA